jgi:hypothetical protein
LDNPSRGKRHHLHSLLGHLPFAIFIKASYLKYVSRILMDNGVEQCLKRTSREWSLYM